MRGTRVALAAALAALLAPASALAVPPTFTATLEYGSTQSDLVATGTITEGSAQYFEIWLNQPSTRTTRAPTDVQFGSNPPGTNGTCNGGVQQNRDFVACNLAPAATAGTTLTIGFKVAAPYPLNGGAEATMIAPPGGFANTKTIQVAGPTDPPEDPCEKLLKKVKKAKRAYREAKAAIDNADTPEEKEEATAIAKEKKRVLRKAKRRLDKCETSQA